MVRTGTWGCWCRRSAGWRFGPFVGQAIPLMVEAWRRAPEEGAEPGSPGGLCAALPAGLQVHPFAPTMPTLDSLPAFTRSST